MPAFDLDTSLASSPEWLEVQAQMQAEMQPPFNIGAAQAAFISSFKEMNTQRGIDPALAIDTAKKFVAGDRTMSGALDTVGGLVSLATEDAPPEEVVQQFTAVIVGAAVAAGAVSAGVGAMIAVGVEVTVEILDALGLFGAAGGQTVCGRTFDPKPDWVVGCVGVYGTRVPGPKNLGWRKFPVASNPADSDWFGVGSDNIAAQIMQGGNSDTDPIYGPQHKIGAAFPAYWRLQSDIAREPDGPFADFLRAFYSAWKSNNEYALNGLKASADWQVALHILGIWNHTHSNSSVHIVNMQDDPTLGWDTSTVRSSPVPYLAVLVKNIRQFSGNPETDAPNNSITINTGYALPAIPPRNVSNLHSMLQGVKSLTDMTPAELQSQLTIAKSGKMVAIGALTVAKNNDLIANITAEITRRGPPLVQQMARVSSAFTAPPTPPNFFVRLWRAFFN